MQQPTLDYAKVDESTQTLRRQIRQTVAWVTIAYATAHLAVAGIQITNVRALTVARGEDLSFAVGAAVGHFSAYPVLLLAGVLLLLDTPKATLVLRISAGVLVVVSVAYASFALVSLRRPNLPNAGLIHFLITIGNACFPLLIALLPLQQRRPRG